MKKITAQLLVLIFAVFTASNIYINKELRPLVKKYSPGTDYLFACAITPDRVILADFSSGNLTAPFVMIDLNLGNIIKKDYVKAVDGIIAAWAKVRFVKKPGAIKPDNGQAKPFAIPFCRYLYIFNSAVEFEDIEQKYRFYISGINGISSSKGNTKSEEFLTLDCTGNIFGKPGQKVFLKMYFFPYYTNKFFVNIFATGINPKLFEPMFRKNRIKFDAGRINFIVQLKGEMRRIYVNNIMQFEKVKMREETGLDVKALFNVSVEQLTDFLKDSDGNFYINFKFDIDDSDFGNIFKYYGDAFKSSISDRLKLGIITAPLRGLGDLLWNLTGENVVRIYKLFGGE